MSDYYMKHEKELSDFVNREVIYCVSYLVSEIQAKEEFGGFEELYQGAPSYGEWECPDCFETWDGEPWENECPDCKAEADLEDNFEASEYSEIYEHWIVTDWLANRLEEKGEAVCKDFYGLTVWGRSCTGQGIALDGVISEIHKELHAKV